MPQNSPENLSPQPVTADLLILRYQMLAESTDPRTTEFVVTDLNSMLDKVTVDEARSIHTELHRQRNELETQATDATAEPISQLQYLVETQFKQNGAQIESADSQLDAARVFAQAIQPKLLDTQDTLLQQTVGQPGSQRRENLSYINQAIGAVALKMIPATK